MHEKTPECMVGVPLGMGIGILFWPVCYWIATLLCKLTHSAQFAGYLTMGVGILLLCLVYFIVDTLLSWFSRNAKKGENNDE